MRAIWAVFIIVFLAVSFCAEAKTDRDLELLITFKQDVVGAPPLSDSVIQSILKRFPIKKIAKVHPSLGKKSSDFFEHVAKIKTRFSKRAKRNTTQDFTELLRMTRLYKLTFLKRDVPLRYVISQLQTSPAIESVEINRIVKKTDVCATSDQFFCTKGSWGQDYDDMWALKKIGADKVWIQTEGEGVKVAVLDTGVDFNHADIKNNIDINLAEQAGSSGADDDDNKFLDDIFGYDFVNNDSDPMDDDGHGTHVAGTIAAEKNNGIGIAGVAPKSDILVVKVLNTSGEGKADAVADGIIYATDRGADVINLSLAGPKTLAEHDAVKYAWSNGVVLVAASGNESTDMSYTFPAAYKETISVASTDTNDEPSDFSNWGWIVDVAAPGGNSGPTDYSSWNILSLRAKNAFGFAIPPPSGEYMILKGTSMAAPHVSGVAALLLAKFPDANVEQVRAAIKNSAASISGAPFGRVDAAGALSKIQHSCASLIISPFPNQMMTGDAMEIKYIVGASIAEKNVTYSLRIGKGLYPSSWIELASGMVDSLMQELSLENVTSSIEGPQSIWLEVKNGSGEICAMDKTVFNISHQKIDLTIYDPTYGDYFGNSVSMLDGNLAIGSPQAYIDSNNSLYSSFTGPGKVYIVPAKFEAKNQVSADQPSFAKAVIVGEEDGSSAGFSVSGEGDVDGDNVSDLLVSAPHFKCDDGKTFCGKIYLILGKNIKNGAITDIASATWTGDINNQNIGKNLAWIGDADGDGFSDFAFTSKQSAFLVLSSKISFAQVAQTMPAQIVQSYWGNIGVARTGDINKDGLSDLLVTMPPNSVSFYDFSGKKIAEISKGGENLILGKDFGNAALACDLNGDAISDVLVAANGDPVEPDERAIYLYDGNKLTGEIGAGSAKDHVIPLGVDDTNIYSSQMACVSDFNLDGIGDFIVSVLNSDVPSTIYLFSGKKSLNLDDGVPEVSSSTFWKAPSKGKPGSLNFGINVLSKDLNQDGIQDIVIGDNWRGLYSGAVYIGYNNFKMDNTVTVKDNCPGIQNPDQADSDGDGVGDACQKTQTASDIDGDGIGDLADNCPEINNPDQEDSNGNGVGDACEKPPENNEPDSTEKPLGEQDTDGDGIADTVDNCPKAKNPDQKDTNGNNIGYACDPSENPILTLTKKIKDVFSSDKKIIERKNTPKPKEIKWWRKIWPF